MYIVEASSRRFYEMPLTPGLQCEDLVDAIVEHTTDVLSMKACHLMLIHHNNADAC